MTNSTQSEAIWFTMAFIYRAIKQMHYVISRDPLEHVTYFHCVPWDQNAFFA